MNDIGHNGQLTAIVERIERLEDEKRRKLNERDAIIATYRAALGGIPR